MKQLNKFGMFTAKVLHIQVNLASSFGSNLTFQRASPLTSGEHCGWLHPTQFNTPQHKLLWQDKF